jgi:acetyl-CoA carboxylase biotin carboxyl carrier protein
MKPKYIQTLIRLVEDSGIESLEITSWGRKVKITQRSAADSNGHGTAPVIMQTPASPAPALTSVAAPEGSPTEVSVEEDTGKLVPIKSPMVGTFYAAPAPDAAPYVSLNERVTAGQVVCIVEAMKLMNEIESEVSGRIVKILGENAKPVEYGQELFLVEPES